MLSRIEVLPFDLPVCMHARVGAVLLMTSGCVAGDVCAVLDMSIDTVGDSLRWLVAGGLCSRSRSGKYWRYFGTGATERYLNGEIERVRGEGLGVVARARELKCAKRHVMDALVLGL